MELITVLVDFNRRGKVKAKIQEPLDEEQQLKLGEYALVKLDSLYDRIAVEKFIEERKNK